jgi:hypothetical protein
MIAQTYLDEAITVKLEILVRRTKKKRSSESNQYVVCAPVSLFDLSLSYQDGGKNSFKDWYVWLWNCW